MTKMLQKDWEKEYSYAGGFQTALMRAIECADHINLAKLEKEYPDIVEVYRKYSGKYWKEAKDETNNHQEVYNQHR